MNAIWKSILVLAVVTGVVATAPTAQATNRNCVDGSVRANIDFKWNSRDTITVGTVNNQPLCADVDIYMSSYAMPDNYNGKGFVGNPTATPQVLHASTLYTLKKGATKPVVMTVDVPDECTNIQSDIYYPPEVREVGPSGHPSNQIINGKIFAKTKDDCQPELPEEPVVEEPEVIDEPEQPAKQKPEVLTAEVTELPQTGVDNGLLLSGLAASVGTYAAAYRLRR